MATPQVPQRPARSQQAGPPPQSMGVPSIPPRPQRSMDRLVAERDSYARSPLNDPAYHKNRMGHHKAPSTDNLPERPPSVSLPSIGQEGDEYASMEDLSKTFSKTHQSKEAPVPEQMKNVAGDLPLHAPTASLPKTSAKARIATVTRTDSDQAAAHGFGQHLADTNKEQDTSPLTRSVSNDISRPSSIFQDEEEHGIPEIGVQVPMYPNAGDVQAPTPGPQSATPSTGVGFFNNVKPGEGSVVGRNHSRKGSGREVFHGPPGSYGLHVHGHMPQDPIEREWYKKHPEEAAKIAQGQYGPAIADDRHEWALSSEDLNKLVRDTAQQGQPMAASPLVFGTPDEQIGYRASEEYASRVASPQQGSVRPPSISTQKNGRTSSQPHAESPLRRMSFPANVHGGAVDDDDNVIHIDPPAQKHDKYAAGSYDAPTPDLGPKGGNTEEKGGFITEEGHGFPILASDEVMKRPGSEFMRPAVSPEMARRGSEDYASFDAEYRSTSRPVSRNQSSGFGHPLSKYISYDEERTGTPLDMVQEYEPLFPEDEKEQDRPKSANDKVRRPDLARHHFPSQDVWEDTPSSLMYQTTVQSPQLPEDRETSLPKNSAAQVFEKPEEEGLRKVVSRDDQTNFLDDHTKKFARANFNKDVMSDMPTRPGIQRRFPSQDIWEDTPSELQLVTTVGTPEAEQQKSPEEALPKQMPSIPARPPRSKQGLEISPTDKKAPIIPERPKPQIPVRPAKREIGDEGTPLSKVTSAGSDNSQESASSASTATVSKPKPPVPQRPGGSKLAALKAGFMNDLNSRLQLGPQAPPKIQEPSREAEEEEAAEKAPLADARKGRARGPARRKPAASPSGAAAEAEAPSTIALSISSPWTIWSIGEDGEVDTPSPAPATRQTVPTGAEEHVTEAPSTSAVSTSTQPETTELTASAPGAFPSETTGRSIATAPQDKEANIASAVATLEDKAEEMTAPLKQTTSKESAVQTGQQELELSSPEKGTEKMTAYVDGKATGGNVLVPESGEKKTSSA